MNPGPDSLHRACRDHNLSLIQDLSLTDPAFNPNHPDQHGRYPLHECVASLPCVAYLVGQAHADVNACKRGDWSVLAVAANKGCADVVEYLVAQGADVWWRTKEGYLPIHLAAAEAHVEVVRSLLATGCHGDEGEIRRMCRERTRSGMLPVHLAALKGSADTVELLLSHSDDVETTDNGGATPLFHACSSGNEDLVRGLIEGHNAQVQVKDKLGREPVAHAAIAGHESIVGILQHHGADLAAPDGFQGFTPLHHACKEGHLALVKFLVERGVPRDVLDLKGRTPSEIAKIWKQEEITVYLASL